MALDYLGNVKFGSEPPQFPADSNGFEGFFSGWAAGSALREERAQSKEAGKNKVDAGGTRDAQGNDTSSPNVTSDSLLGGLVHNDQTPFREPKGPSFMDSLARSFLGAKGEVAKGADPLFEVRKLTAEQSAKMQALQIGEALQRRQNMLESRGAMLDFSEMITDALKMPDPAAAQGQIGEFMARHPALFETDEGKGMWKQYEGALDRLDKGKVQERLLKQYEMQYGPDGTRLRIADLNAQTTLERARVQAEGATKRAQIMAEASIERAEILANVQRDNARVKAIRDRAGDTIYRSFLVQASAIKDSIDLTDAQKQAQIQALEDEYLGRLREAAPAIPVVPLTPPASDALLQGLAPATNVVTPPASGNKRIIYRPK